MSPDPLARNGLGPTVPERPVIIPGESDMLARRLEPEVMERPDEAEVYDAMDHQEVNRQFVEDLLDFTTVDGEVLDLGTGPAQIPIHLCRQVPSVRVVAVDLSVSMLEVARIRLELAQLTDRILLLRVDAKQLPMEDSRFAGVISNSIVHHLADPMAAFREADRVVADGGFLFFRDLVRPGDEETLQRLVEQYAGQECEQARQMFADSLRAALTVDEVQTIITQLGYPASSVCGTSDRHWTWAARKHVG